MWPTAGTRDLRGGALQGLQRALMFAAPVASSNPTDLYAGGVSDFGKLLG